MKNQIRPGIVFSAHTLMDNPDFRGLKGNSVKLFLEMSYMCICEGVSAIQMPHRTIIDRLGTTKLAAKKALKELLDKGFIELVKKGTSRGHPSEYTVPAVAEGRIFLNLPHE